MAALPMMVAMSAGRRCSIRTATVVAAGRAAVAGASTVRQAVVAVLVLVAELAQQVPGHCPAQRPQDPVPLLVPQERARPGAQQCGA